MEDSHIACLDMKVDLCDAQISDERQAFLNGIAVFGVFDGHGGKNNKNNTHCCFYHQFALLYLE
jgi:serine/threonine protein phosphatase PrpC